MKQNGQEGARVFDMRAAVLALVAALVALSIAPIYHMAESAAAGDPEDQALIGEVGEDLEATDEESAIEEETTLDSIDSDTQPIAEDPVVELSDSTKSFTADNVEAQDVVVKIGDTSYNTFAEAVAVANATSGATLVLQSNQTINSKATFTSNATLDLNGMTLTVAVASGLTSESGVLTIKNGSISGTTDDIFTADKGTISLASGLNAAGTSSLIWAKNGGNVLVEGANLTRTTGKNNLAYAEGAGSSITVSAGSLNASNERAPIVVENQGAAYIKGGSVICDNENAIIAKNTGNVSIEGGVIESKDKRDKQAKVAVWIYNASVHMTGGTIRQTGKGAALSVHCNSSAVVAGGTIESAENYGIYLEDSSPNLTISGSPSIKGLYGIYAAPNDTATASATINIGGGRIVGTYGAVAHGKTGTYNFSVTDGWFSSKVPDEYVASGYAASDAVDGHDPAFTVLVQTSITASAASSVFTGETIVPTLTVKTADGAELSEDAYEISSYTAKGNSGNLKDGKPCGADTYTVTVKATAKSGISAETTCDFVIAEKKAEADAATGVSASGSAFAKHGAGEYVDLTVADLATTNASRLSELQEKYQGANNLFFKVYDVNLLVKKIADDTQVGEALADNFGTLTLSFPVDAKFNGMLAKVTHLHKVAGGVEELTYNPVVADGAITIEVDRMSEFVVSIDDSGAASTTIRKGSGTKKTALAETGDPVNPALPLGLAFAAVAVAGVAVQRIRRDS